MCLSFLGSDLALTIFASSINGYVTTKNFMEIGFSSLKMMRFYSIQTTSSMKAQEE